MKALLSYEKDTLARSGRLIIPLLLLIAYIGIAYAIAPLDILTSYSISALAVFLLSLSAGVMAAGLNHPMIEQTMLVKLPRKYTFYLSRVLLMAGVALVFGLLAVFGPLLIHVCSASGLFKRPVTLPDVLSALALIWLISFSGCVSGLLTSSRIIPGRRGAILLGTAFGVLVVVKGALIKNAAWLVFVLWMLPPVYDLTVVYSADSYFYLGNVWPYFLWMTLYAAAEAAVYVRVMTKRRFA